MQYRPVIFCCLVLALICLVICEPALAATTGHGGEVVVAPSDGELEQLAQLQQMLLEVACFLAGVITSIIVAITWRY